MRLEIPGSGPRPPRDDGPKTARRLDVSPLPPYTSARSLQGQRICPRGAPNGGRNSLGLRPKDL